VFVGGGDGFAASRPLAFIYHDLADEVGISHCVLMLGVHTGEKR
jgi:hypothetical protein